jgi:excisionase family DNA binding protein
VSLLDGHLTIRELADRLGLGVDQVRGLVDRGAISSVSFGFGTRRYIPIRELHRLRTLGFHVQSEQTTRNEQESRPARERTNVDS